MELKFRTLQADEIEVRVGQTIATTNWQGATLLLYKNARVDQDILDETVGAMNWQRRHLRDNANCEVGIYDTDKQEWVWKEDTGTESNTEAEKGLASDSFKRACVNWGIGRELYSSPVIMIPCTLEDKNGRKQILRETTFNVEEIRYNDKRKISYLRIGKAENHVHNAKAFVWSDKTPQPQEQTDKPKIDVNAEKLDKAINKSTKPQTPETMDLQAVKTSENTKASPQRQVEDMIKAMVATKVATWAEIQNILINEYGADVPVKLSDDLAKEFLARLKKWEKKQ